MVNGRMRKEQNKGSSDRKSMGMKNKRIKNDRTDKDGDKDLETREQTYNYKHKKVKQSLYTPWRRLGGEEV
jgi:hypothetical protein